MCAVLIQQHSHVDSQCVLLRQSGENGIIQIVTCWV